MFKSGLPFRPGGDLPPTLAGQADRSKRSELRGGREFPAALVKPNPTQERPAPHLSTVPIWVGMPGVAGGGEAAGNAGKTYKNYSIRCFFRKYL
jgi:hypothetical protein